MLKKLFKSIFKSRPKVHTVPGDYPVKENGFPFHLNPVQSYFHDNYVNTNNAVVESGTGTGKTNIAWLAADSFLREGRKIIYLAPTKALVYEKYREVANMWGKSMVGLKTGEKKDLVGNEYVIVTTPESYLSAIRRKEPWAEGSLVISDEIQFLLDPGRGGELDIALTISNFKESRILGLSGFLPQKEGIAKWLKGDLFISGWNPVKRHVKEIEVNDEKKFPTLQAILKEHSDKYTIIFVPTLKEGHSLSESLSAPFHFRDLPKEKRQEIEEAFRKGDLQVLISTNTLAYGVNTPADVVVVYGTRRGWDYLSRVDVIQEIGRAGRFPKTEAWAYVVGDKIEIYHARNFVENKEARLVSMESLVMTKLSMEETSRNGLKSLALNTYSAQGKSPIEVEKAVDSVCNYLKGHQLIRDNGNCSLTGEGGILSKYYLSPYRYIAFMRIARKIEKSDILQPFEKGCLALAELMPIPYIGAPKGIAKSFEVKLFQADAKKDGKHNEAAVLKGIITGAISPRPKGLEYSLKDAERWLGAFSDMQKYLKRNDLPLMDDLNEVWKKLRLLYMKGKERQIRLFD